MKPQDILFFLVVLILIYKHNSRFTALIGLFCLIFSIPLFAKWVFFTAERLTWYAAACFFLSIVFYYTHVFKDKMDAKK
jgi:hypothetical protein